LKPPGLRAFANSVLALTAVDALVSLLDELVQAAGGPAWLGAPRGALAELAFAGLALCVPVMLATPRLPISVFVPLVLVTFWVTFGAAPLALWIPSAEAVDIARCALQLAAAAVAFAVVRARNGGRGIWLGDAEPDRPAFAWRHSLAFAAALATLGPVLALGYGAVAVATELQVMSHGFVRVGLDGVSLDDRYYQRDGREIRLVGMMHIGDPERYRAITRSFSRESTIVLAEGVSDDAGRLSSSLQYGNAARAIGLSPQANLESYLVEGEGPDAVAPKWPVVRRADIDASQLEPETIETIRWASEVWDAEDLPTALQRILRASRELGPERSRAFFADVVDRRNAHLVGELERALREYERVVVPWGALHLPGIEQTVLSWGFAETSRVQHRLFAWSTVAAALF
jgi:hypothetical protein